MRPIEFEESNKLLTKPHNMTDEECQSLPVFNDGKVSISLWSMSPKERLLALIFGRLWLYVHGGSTQPPVALVIKRTVFPKEDRKIHQGYQPLQDTLNSSDPPQGGFASN